VAAALPRLAISLATVAQCVQQFADHALADLETLRAQRRDEMALAATDPAQRRHGSPRIASSISFSSAAGNPGWCATALWRPPPGRRCRDPSSSTWPASLADHAVIRRNTDSGIPQLCMAGIPSTQPSTLFHKYGDVHR